VSASGGSAAFGTWAARHVKTRAGAQLATFAMGVLIFIDDYFNCLTVGAVMRPVTDKQRVSRAKLAYIIDATAAPICMIAPISSWAAAVSATAADLGGDLTGIQLFVQAIPYNFYSLLTIAFVIIICVMGFDYGPMAKAELAAYRDGNLGSLGNDGDVQNTRARLVDMLLPVIVLIVACVLGMLYVGGFWDPEAEGYHDLAVAFGDTDASVGLPWGSIIALVFAFIYMLARRVVTFKQASECIVAGFKAMVPALLILTFALTLKLATSALGADVYVAGLMEGAAQELYAMLPAIIFLVGLGLAFATGTSWGTFGILIPIVLPIFSAAPELLTVGISACLAGAVCGDHISPISDTTIMASAGANVNHVEHVSTQLPYALTVGGISFVCFVVAGFVQNWVICLAVGIVLTVVVLFVLRATVGVNVAKEAGAAEK
jgi:Na+/H+ antiporter NhaC